MILEAARVLRRCSPAIAIVVVGLVTATAGDPSPSEAPVDLAHPGSESCPKGQVSSERGCVTPPEVLKLGRPRFPDQARRAQHGARVTVKVVITAEGKVDRVEVLESTRTGEGFEDSAAESAKATTYKPARLGGKPIAVAMTTVVTFVAP